MADQEVPKSRTTAMTMLDIVVIQCWCTPIKIVSQLKLGWATSRSQVKKEMRRKIATFKNVNSYLVSTDDSFVSYMEYV